MLTDTAGGECSGSHRSGFVCCGGMEQQDCPQAYTILKAPLSSATRLTREERGGTVKCLPRKEDWHWPVPPSRPSGSAFSVTVASRGGLLQEEAGRATHPSTSGVGNNSHTPPSPSHRGCASTDLRTVCLFSSAWLWLPRPGNDLPAAKLDPLMADSAPH